MASYSLLPAYNLSTCVFPCKKTRSSKPLQVKAQIYRDNHHHHHPDQGRSSRDVVETNLQLLRLRIEEVRNKERLERCCLAEHGWNYAPYTAQTMKSKRDEEMLEFLQLVGMMASTFGFTISTCTFSLCIASLLLHSNLF